VLARQEHSKLTWTDHFDLRTNSFALNPEGNWFDFVRKDAITVHAHLAVISPLRNITLGIADETDAQLFRAQTIHEINLRLAKERDSRLSEALIAAVALIVNREVIRPKPNFVSCLYHIGGSRKL
jgi:hypothetical protein